MDVDHGIMQVYALGLADADPSKKPSLLNQSPHQSQLSSELKDWKEIRQHLYKTEFIKAMHTEKDGLMSRGTYSVCDHPDRKWLIKNEKRVISLKWMFSYKFDEDSYLAKFKACICTQDDMQAVINEETRAVILATHSFHIMMALVTAFDLETDQLDAVNAFLNSDLNEKKYVYMPPGMRQTDLSMKAS